MRRPLLLGVLGFALFTLPTSARAGGSPLNLYYEVVDFSGGEYTYEFTLTLDDSDLTWFPGQRFEWIIFGDQLFGPSPLTDFVGNPGSLPIGPFTGYSISTGQHNGPTLAPVSLPWIPSAPGVSLVWSGTSTADLLPGQLLFSCLGGSGELPNLQVAIRLYPSITFRRGDINQDGLADVSDVIFLVTALFIPLAPQPLCDSSADVNDDGAIDVSDAVTLLAALFIPGTPPLPAPAAFCGIDPTSNGLDCTDFVGCP